jgi:hypothetical protein
LNNIALLIHKKKTNIWWNYCKSNWKLSLWMDRFRNF